MNLSLKIGDVEKFAHRSNSHEGSAVAENRFASDAAYKQVERVSRLY